MKTKSAKSKKARIHATQKEQTHTEFKVRAHFYCGLMGESISALVSAYRLRQEIEKMQRSGDNSQEISNLLTNVGILVRYAFLVACNALENSAYAILVNSGKLSTALAEDIDKLKTLNKFEVFALIHGKAINRGDNRYERLRQVVKCRNDFVHPKGTSVGVRHDVAFAREVSGRKYPLAFDFIELDQTAMMVGDILNFIAWAVFDLCEFSVQGGVQLINGDVGFWISDFHEAKEIWGYDLRSLGDFQSVSVRNIKTI